MTIIGTAFKTCWISCCCYWLLILAVPIHSQDKKPSLESEQFTYRVHIETLNPPPLGGLSHKYHEALVKLQEKFQKAGDLEGIPTIGLWMSKDSPQSINFKPSEMMELLTRHNSGQNNIVAIIVLLEDFPIAVQQGHEILSRLGNP